MSESYDPEAVISCLQEALFVFADVVRELALPVLVAQNPAVAERMLGGLKMADITLDETGYTRPSHQHAKHISEVPGRAAEIIPFPGGGNNSPA